MGRLCYYADLFAGERRGCNFVLRFYLSCGNCNHARTLCWKACRDFSLQLAGGSFWYSKAARGNWMGCYDRGWFFSRNRLYHGYIYCKPCFGRFPVEYGQSRYFGRIDSKCNGWNNNFDFTSTKTFGSTLNGVMNGVKT